jgi:hypothetical protein
MRPQQPICRPEQTSRFIPHRDRSVDRDVVRQQVVRVVCSQLNSQRQQLARRPDTFGIDSRSHELSGAAQQPDGPGHRLGGVSIQPREIAR